jgi:hypothetical protein
VKSILRRRPSPALVIALIALFISLSGVAYGVATGSIDSREIKNNAVRSRDLRNNDIRTRDLRNNEIRGRDIRNSTVQGRDVALNTLTGGDINESRLGRVPSATSATSATSANTAATATSAGNANTVGGMSVRKVFAKLPAGNPGQEVFRNAYFALVGSCQGSSAGLRIVAVAGAPVTNATVHSINQTVVADFLSTNNLASGAGLDLIDAGNEGSATVAVSTTDGRVSTVVISTLNPPAFSGENVCAVRGTVTSG